MIFVGIDTTSLIDHENCYNLYVVHYGKVATCIDPNASLKCWSKKETKEEILQWKTDKKQYTDKSKIIYKQYGNKK